MSQRSALTAHSLTFAYHSLPILEDINLELQPGSLHALIGPNGSGKTTLLKLLLGILKPKSGVVSFNGADLTTLSRRELARHIALVPQELNLQFSFTVRQMVMLGRTPHLRAMAGPASTDRAVVERVMELTDTATLADRIVTELSGGEQQRVVIAMALAQEPHALLLDEPTVHLDLSHQVEILNLLRTLNRTQGLTILATMHDLNLAALYFDTLILLDRGNIVAQGTPAAILKPDLIRSVFHTDVLLQSHPTHPHIPQLIPNPPQE